MLLCMLILIIIQELLEISWICRFNFSPLIHCRSLLTLGIIQWLLVCHAFAVNV